ncbi:MAG: uncharacterized protein K0R24_1775 [Gammaproteobacteria bacterium]|jgi:uncharacterized protein YciI|nr:uncharacterized protein [Gammaproteobacteria bacterium]
MFIIILTYKKSLADVDKHLDEHKKFLDNGYIDNFFVASGPKNPRNGGIIISQLKNRDQLEDIIKQDPFNIHNVADYQIIEFTPTKYHTNFASFIELH